MKLTTKRVSIAGLGVVCALSLAAGANMLIGNNSKAAFAEGSGVPSAVYYYDNLTDNEGKSYTLAKKFYDVLDKLNKEGDFKDGLVDYDLKDMMNSDQIKSWVSDGNLAIPKAFRSHLYTSPSPRDRG